MLKRNLNQRRLKKYQKSHVINLQGDEPLINIEVTLALGNDRGDVLGYSFITFLAPGLIIQSMILQSFSHSVSSFMISKMQDTFSRLSRVGLLISLFAGFLVNLGMISGLLPIVGAPLPFFSYGGTSIITSNQFAVSAISNKGSINGIISGTGNPVLEIGQLPAYESLAIGDYFLTSGLGGIYPRGIKIGKVTKIIPTYNTQFNRIIITPFSSPLSFSEVMLIRNNK